MSNIKAAVLNQQYQMSNIKAAVLNQQYQMSNIKKSSIKSAISDEQY